MPKKISHTLSKQDIQDFVQEDKSEKWRIVKKIQEMKEDTVKRLLAWFWQSEIKFIDPALIKGVEKEYFKLLQDEDWKNNNGQSINPWFDSTALWKESENMFKPHVFKDNYIKKFHEIAHSHLLETPKNKLQQRKKDLLKNRNLWIKEKEELASITTLLEFLDSKNITPTKSRAVLFDSKQFVDTPDIFNIQCFFEQDKQWHKHYFSLYELLNDLETFGVESWYPIVDMSEMWAYKSKFSSAQKRIKLALIKNILAKYRDYQEVLMYNFKDYEKEAFDTNYHNNKPWLLAEKVVEWTFRNFASLDKDPYDIKITKASIGEDQSNKIDIIIEIKDKKSWINIQKEFQLTINHDKQVLSYKKQQILRQQALRWTNLDLLELELNLLDQKVSLWRNLDRPIWWLNDLLSIEDKEFLKATYERIIHDLKAKIR